MPPRLSRRHFLLAAGGTVAAGLGVAGYATAIEPEWIEIVERPLRIPDLPVHWQGKTLLHLSDLHAGDRVSAAYLREVFARARGLAPDLVVYTGDFIDSDPSRFSEIAPLLRELPLGKSGSFGVLGNHDYGAGWSQADLAMETSALLSAHGIQMLANRSVDLSGWFIAGCDDLWAGRCNPARALKNHRHGAALLALAHNPDIADEPAWRGLRCAMLAGHTHGGQCKPPFLPPPILPVKNKRYAAGHYALEPERSLYISRGVGHLTRVRFNVRPEMTLFTLEC